ncbi:MAG: PSD1 and planctomycete cytochrome C domain-containing protein [Pirellulaceae bacterium]|nr:PSD1 and planctomycete cytochrome C domain-containing protein [Pirellulaceae bacterium]
MAPYLVNSRHSLRPLAFGLLVACFSVRVFAAEPAVPPPTSRPVDFAADIQPLFRKHCYSCHGSEHQEGGLRLDQKKRALEGGDSGAEIVAGNSAQSRLVRMIAGVDDQFGRMPPEEKGKPLTAVEIGLVRAWIDQGAKWPDDADLAQAATRHWSFQPVRRTIPPHVADSAWLASPVDAFVLARLEALKLKPSAAAERATLLRRLHLDLVGLVPSAAEVEAFLADERPDAIERVIDRLLASPHFGERWGRHWLDLARYADSDGYEKDKPRPFAWRYRDWVIQAINADLTYDRFTAEQLAGDLLPGAGIAERTASGFHRNTLHNTEGGADPEEDRVKKTVDRTNTLGAVWLGLTVGCAQCHSHKYDALSQREYFSLYAFFDSLQETDIEAPTAAEVAQLAADKLAHAEKLKTLEAAVAAYETQSLAAAEEAWEAKLTGPPAVWQSLDLSSGRSEHEATMAKQPDGSVLVSGRNELSDVYYLEATIPSGKATALRLEVLPDPSLPKQGPGRSKSGNFVLATFSVSARPVGDFAPATDVEIGGAKADFAQKEWGVELATNDVKTDGWAISPQFGQRHVAVFELKEPLGYLGGTQLFISLDQSYNLKDPHNIGRFRLSYSTSALPVPLEGVPAAAAEALAKPRLERTREEQQALRGYYRTIDPELKKLTQAVAEHQAKAPKLPDDCKAQTVSQLAQPRATRIHLRGDFLSPGDAVTVGTPAVLPPIQPRGKTPDRLDLAAWLVDPANPLPARVAANRVWQQLFGRGIVSTSDDFGKQGEKPSHPDLLDWLASEYAAGWSLKDLVRTIILSATYRQSSAPRADLLVIDPENVWLARQARRRVESEIIRDISLTAAGQLAERIGGPSVRPPQPAEYASVTYANSAKWVESRGGDRYRRAMYTFFQRTSPYPMLMTFDTPDSNECAARRQTSNTPLQALTLWNDPVFFECAQALGRRVVAEVPASADPRQTAHARARHAFALALSRPPSEAELGDVLKLYDTQVQLAQQDQAAARQLVGPAPQPAGTHLADLAAWISVGRALLNLDEFIVRE